MDNERQGKLIAIGCQTAALVAVIAMIAGQYHAMTTPHRTQPQQLPVTGSSTTTEPKTGFVGRLLLRRTVQARYDQIAGLEGLSAEQQASLAAIAEQLYG